MTTTTGQRKGKTQRTVSLNFYNREKGVGGFTVKEGAKVDAYCFETTPHPQLLGFLVLKVDDPAAEVYAIELDPAHGFNSCTCLGHTRYGHCRHVGALLALSSRAKI